MCNQVNITQILLGVRRLFKPNISQAEWCQSRYPEGMDPRKENVVKAIDPNLWKKMTERDRIAVAEYGIAVIERIVGVEASGNPLVIYLLTKDQLEPLIRQFMKLSPEEKEKWANPNYAAEVQNRGKERI